MLTDAEAKVIDYLFEGAKVYYSETKKYIEVGGKPVDTFIVNNSNPLSTVYKAWHIKNHYRGEVKILKIHLTQENRKRIYEYLGIT